MFLNRRGGHGSSAAFVGPSIIVAVCLSLFGFWSVVQGRTSRDSDFTRLTSASSGALDRIQAAESLAQRRTAAVPQLVKALSNPDLKIRRSVAYCLSRIGAGEFEIPPQIPPLLNDADSVIRGYVTLIIAHQSRDDEYVLKIAFSKLLDPSPGVRRIAHRVIERKGRDALPQLCELADHPDWRLRYKAAELLGAINEVADEKTSVIRRLRHDRDCNVRRAAFVVLSGMQLVTCSELVSALGDDDRQLALFALQKTVPRFLPANKELVGGLERLLSSPKLEVQLTAALMIAQAGPEARSTIPTLAHHLRSLGGIGRLVIADVLATLGAAPSEFVPVLTEVVFETDCVDSVWWSAYLLGRHAPADVATILPRIENRMEDRDFRVHFSALAAMTGFGAAATNSVPALTRVVSSDDTLRSTMAAVVLRQMGPSARQAVPALIERLKKNIEDFHLRYAAGRELEEASPEPFGYRLPDNVCVLIHSMRPQMIECWREDRVECPVTAVIKPLGEIAHGDTRALDAVLLAADDPSPLVRCAVASAIADLECDSPRTMVYLRRLSKDENSLVSGRAKRAIDHLRRDSAKSSKSST